MSISSPDKSPLPPSSFESLADIVGKVVFFNGLMQDKDSSWQTNHEHREAGILEAGNGTYYVITTSSGAKQFVYPESFDALKISFEQE